MKQKIGGQKVSVSQAVAREDLISPIAAAADYADCYRFDLLAAKPIDARALQLALWSTQPWIVEKLLALRDLLVRPLGLQSGRPPAEEWVSQGERSRKLYTSGKLVDEQVITVDDKHLRFLVSIKTVSWPHTDQKRVLVTTAVYWHNFLGRLYFAAIRPVHGTVVSMSMTHILRKLTEEEK